MSASAQPLIGRDTELRLLGELSERPGRPAAFVVSGDPGVGKSALVAQFSADARADGRLVLSAIGVETEATLPFAALRELLLPILAEIEELPSPSRSALHSALGLAATTPPDRDAIAHALGLLIRGVAARRRILMVVDDVQWVDAATQSTLATVIPTLDGERVSVVFISRLGYDVPVLSGNLPELRVEPLDDDASARLLRRVAPALPAEDASVIRSEAQGNPLALIELPGVRLMSRPGPSATDRPLSARLEGAFAARLEPMSSLTRDVLLCAAVDDESDVREVMAAASVLAAAPIEDEVLSDALSARLVFVDRDGVRFRHPLVRSSLLRAESAWRKMRAHAALSSVIEDPQRRAWHLAQSRVGPDDEVADLLEAAVPAALLRGGVETAIANLERAAELTTNSILRGSRLLAAAQYAFDIGRADTVDRLLTDAAKEDLDERGLARLHLLREIFDDGTPGDAHRVLELCEHARRAAALGDTSLALDLLLGAALRCWWADTGPEARSRVVAVTQTVEGFEHDARYIAALAVAEPVTMCATVVALLDAHDGPHDASADELRLLGMAAHAIGDEPRADLLLRAAESELRAQGRVGLLAHVLSMSVVVRQELGDLQGAATAAEEGRRLADATGQPIWNSGTIVCESRACALRGDADRALELAADAERLARQRRLNDLLACVQLAKGMAWFVSGHADDALEAFTRMFDPADPAFHQRERFDGIMLLAEAARATADEQAIDRARTVLRDLELVAAMTPSPLLHAQLAYARPMLAEDAEAGALFEQAVVLDLTGWPWVSARVALEYGSWLGRQGRHGEARIQLTWAREAFAAMSAAPWVEMTEGRIALFEMGEDRG